MNRDSTIEEIRRELATLRIEYDALLKSHRELALRTLGDTPETAALLDEIPASVVENYPQWMK